MPKKLILTVFLIVFVFCVTEAKAEHPLNGFYSGQNLEQVAFPLGGFGSGMFCLEGYGAVSHLSVHHHMDFFNEPTLFAAICLKGKTEQENQAKVLEGPIPDHLYFDRPGAALGSGERTYGLPRFTECQFSSQFPFCHVRLKDRTLPVEVTITGFSPFIPNEADLSSFPAASLEYSLTNPTSENIEAVFSVNARNFMGGDRFGELKNGFRVIGPEGEFALAIQTDQTSDNAEDPNAEPNLDAVHVDHCWFRGGWFDSLSMTWNNIQRGVLIDNPPVENNAPGASLFVPVKLGPHETRTIRLLTAWFVPQSKLVASNSAPSLPMEDRPAHGTAENQDEVSGYTGNGLVNTFFPNGDAHVGKLLSPEFNVDRKYLHFQIGGGNLNGVGVSLGQKRDDGSFLRLETLRGKNAEALSWVTWDLESLQGKTVQIEILDKETGAWGHINADQFVLSDLPLDSFLATDQLDWQESVLLADFENEDYDLWKLEQFASSGDSVPATYTPWYTTKFHSVQDVLHAFDQQYEALRNRSELFAQTLKKSTLPPEVLEAVEANLTILKSPTLLRQQDGRLWGWEGNQDQGGSCAGTCTHVWNYSQALCHLFPALERTFRQTEFSESLTDDGRQAFRANLPISPGGIAWDASDGQLGTLMRVHREWKISGSQDFLEEYWPAVQKSIDFAIRTWDPDETGLLEKSHHNTYDINYLGPEGHCGSFYLGALAAVIKMGVALGQDVSRYQAILEKGRHRMETELFNGEYFIQKIPAAGVDANPDDQSEYYKELARLVNSQGPKYQYGNGCLSDGVLGFWMAKVCGIEEDLIDPGMIRSHLLAVYRYNFKPDLSDHSNPQRPTYAMGNEGGLLLCSWPHLDKPLLPFVYSDEVWTGIEYQVASHLMMIGEQEKGLEIVRACRQRYDGNRRNPFNEFECGHWYARAMSSFALLQGMTGVRYDAVSKTLSFNCSEDDYSVPLFTESGYGTIFYHAENQTISIEIAEGTIDIQSYEKNKPN